jgi:hypothetical protein
MNFFAGCRVFFSGFEASVAFAYSFISFLITDVLTSSIGALTILIHTLAEVHW